MNAHSTPGQTDALVLRVISGRQAGAEYRLASGIGVSVGHGFQHDIVLRVPSAKDVSIQLEIGNAVAKLTMQSGSATLLGRPLSAGDNAQLPHYVPLMIGDASFAIGSPDSERWGEAAQLQDDPAPASILPTPASGSVPQTAADPINGISQRFGGALAFARLRLRPLTQAIAIENKWPIYAVVAATALIALLLFNPVSSWVGEAYFGPSAAEKMLRDSGFKDVTVQENAGGGLLVKGLVRDDAQLTRLRRLISDRQSAAVIDVNTIDGLASGVTDLLTAQGLDAEARAGRGKTILIDSEYLPGDRQEEIIAQIRKDMPVLNRIVFNINPDRGEPMLQYFFASAKYGIASFVDGDPAYISTANGDKWFKGAAVPTGHMIIEIGNGRVRFEREGKIEELTFASGAEETPAADEGASGVKVSDVKERTKL